MPFGLFHAPATFQSLMGAIMGDLAFEVLLYFIVFVDVIVFSRDFESHMEKLDLVFGRSREHGLKLKPLKCLSEVKFLRHVVSAEGVRA